MTVPCQKAFAARRFVGQVINQRGFPAVFAEPQNGFIRPEFCFVAASATKQSRLSPEKTRRLPVWFKGRDEIKARFRPEPVRLAGPPAAR
jgi:hypothetical protein